MRAGRRMVAAAGMVPAGLQRTVDNQIHDRQPDGDPAGGAALETARVAVARTCAARCGTRRLASRWTRPEAGVLYLVNPREVKFFPLSLLAAAGVFHAAGESWTLSSRVFDVTNYGFFAARRRGRRRADPAGRSTRPARLGVDEIVLSECGHGFRAFRWEGPELARSGATRSRCGASSSCSTSTSTRAGSAWTRAGTRDRVTLHDPCNLVRWGGVSEPQRRVLRAGGAATSSR